MVQSFKSLLIEGKINIGSLTDPSNIQPSFFEIKKDAVTKQTSFKINAEVLENWKTVYNRFSSKSNSNLTNEVLIELIKKFDKSLIKDQTIELINLIEKQRLILHKEYFETIKNIEIGLSSAEWEAKLKFPKCLWKDATPEQQQILHRVCIHFLTKTVK
jgi:hypothetical protein